MWLLKLMLYCNCIWEIFYTTIRLPLVDFILFLIKINGFGWFAAYIAGISPTKFETAVDLSEEPRVTNCKVALPIEEDFFERFYATMQCQFGSSGRYVYIYKLGYGSIVLNEVIVLKEARFNGSTGGYDCEYNLMKMHTVRVLSCFVLIRCSMVTSLLMGSSDVYPRTSEATVVNELCAYTTYNNQDSKVHVVPMGPTWVL